MVKVIFEIIPGLKNIDKFVSELYLYYAATCGFLLGWVCLGVFLVSILDTLPTLFVLLLRVFYFLLSFLFGLKIVIVLMSLFSKTQIY